MPVLDLRTITTRLPSASYSTLSACSCVGREHPDDLDVAAERDRLDAVLRLAALPAPDGRAEADEVLGDLPAERLGRDHVAELVEADRGQDREHEHAPPRAGRAGGRSWSVPLDRRAGRPRRGPRRRRRGRRRRSAAPPRVRRARPSTSATVSTISDEPQPAAAGTPRPPPRWRRCRPPGAVPPAPPPGGPGRTAGNASSSSGKNSQVLARVQSTGGAVSGTRSGQARPSAIGISIVGGLACTSVEPSTNSTIECTTRVGWTTTSIRSKGIAEEQVGLDHLEALVDQGGGVDGDDRAHVPGRVGQRLLDGHVEQLLAGAAAERAAGGGQHEPAYLLGACRPAGTAPAPSARSRPARSGRAWPARAPAGRP